MNKEATNSLERILWRVADFAMKLRFFGGLIIEQVAELKRISKSTVERRWAFARAWLSRKLTATVDPDLWDHLDCFPSLTLCEALADAGGPRQKKVCGSLILMKGLRYERKHTW